MDKKINDKELKSIANNQCGSSTLFLLLALLFVVAGVALFYFFGQPGRKYSTPKFWQTATLNDVDNIPDKLLLPGNKYGTVLSFASAFSNNPDIVQALINRGADVNERDISFDGSALSGAVIYTHDKEVIKVLIENGADFDFTAGVCDENLLMKAIKYGDDPTYTVNALFEYGMPAEKIKEGDCKGHNAIDYAKAKGLKKLATELGRKIN